MNYVLSGIAIVLGVQLFHLFSRQALAHLVVALYARDLDRLPGDRTTTATIGIDDARFFLGPGAIPVLPERRWRVARMWARRTPPWRGSDMPWQEVALARASVHEVRVLFQALRAVFLTRSEIALARSAVQRAIGLCQGCDTSGDDGYDNSSPLPNPVIGHRGSSTPSDSRN